VADPAVNAPTASEVIPAGHAALPAEDEFGEDQSNKPTGLTGLGLAALGVVFGDIGTSPVYTFRECFNSEHGLPLDAEHVLGALSMIFWALIIVVAVKYVLLIMRADNRARAVFSPCSRWLSNRHGANARATYWFYSVSAAPPYSTATA